MANATEVNRTRDLIKAGRLPSVVQEERALDSADDGTVYQPDTAGTFSVTTELLAASVDKWVYIAHGRCRVVGIEEVHSVVGGSGAVVSPRKITGVAAPGAAVAAGITELTTAVIDLTTTVNTVQSPALTATAADLLLADGDKIGLDFAGTLTGLVGSLTIHIMPY